MERKIFMIVGDIRLSINDIVYYRENKDKDKKDTIEVYLSTGDTIDLPISITNFERKMNTMHLNKREQMLPFI